jgi:hypothetical protein
MNMPHPILMPLHTLPVLLIFARSRRCGVGEAGAWLTRALPAFWR